MLTVMLLIALHIMILNFGFLVITVVVAMQHGYPDASFKPAPGRRWPRVTPRTFMAVIRGSA
jgi:hypothetical protein